MPDWELQPPTRSGNVAAIFLLVANGLILGSCTYGALVTHGAVMLVLAALAALSGLLFAYNALMIFVAYVLLPKASRKP